ncbi:riboflavin biosynthesis protein RibF, partial [bacterium]|nr:riboflavin biosynthesis protein RibF [bacterium]
VSSTRIRKSLKNGNVTFANKLLGYNYALLGKVVEGNKLGRTIGFPTANLIYPFSKVQIPYGVYSVSVEIEGQNYFGMLNYGTKPTVNKVGAEPILEVNIFNFDKNIYNKQIKINLIEWIREEHKFSSLTDLKSQIEKDLERCLK